MNIKRKQDFCIVCHEHKEGSSFYNGKEWAFHLCDKHYNGVHDALRSFGPIMIRGSWIRPGEEDEENEEREN